MENADVIPSIVLSAHALARIAAQDAGNEAPSAQWRTLAVLEQTGGMRLGELAHAARTTQPGMTRLVGILEQTGLVSRSSDPADTRVTVVRATTEGMAQLRAWRAEMRDTLAPRFTDLDEDDWSALRRAAGILAAHAQEPTTAGEHA